MHEGSAGAARAHIIISGRALTVRVSTLIGGVFQPIGAGNTAILVT
jgi:hypothetical protein